VCKRGADLFFSGLTRRAYVKFYMPRQARIVVANTPQHIMQRGHNRQVVFAADDDFSYYLENLIDFKQKFDCKVYAYCLMTNHVHLVVDPGNNPESLALLMKRVAGRQTRHINKLEKRSGSLWEGRFKSSVVSTQEYLGSCCRYIELNPLRAGLVQAPEDYKWSSCAFKVNGTRDKLVDLDSQYLALGSNGPERQIAYKDYLVGTIPEDEMALIREALQRCQLTGSNRFRQEVSAKLGVRISNKRPGRPQKT
jgi:putative transposase